MSWLNFLHQYDGLAVIDQNSNNRSLTYKELYQESCAWTEYLINQDVQAGDRVAYYSSNSLDHLTLLFACAKLQAIFVPLNFKAPHLETEKTIQRIEPKIYIEKRPAELKYNQSYDFQNLDESIPALMLFTSGSTGVPKGILMHGEMLKANQINTVTSWGLLQSDRTIVETPFFHTGAFNVLCLPLLSIGGTVVLAEKFDIDNFFNTVSEDKLTVYFGVPTMFEVIEKDPRFQKLNNSSLRFLISGGAPCPERLIKEYQKQGLQFKQGYGLTEVGPNCFVLQEEESLRKIGSIGKPIVNSEVIVIDNDGKIVNQGEIGELCISGAHCCLGYYKDEETFKKKMINGFYKTGDLVCCDEEGFYFVKGRKKEMYISGGENVYPQEVERVLMEHEDLEVAQIVPVPDPKWGEVGYVYYTAKKELSKDDLEAYLKPRLTRFKHPKYFKQVSEFALLANGKIDKKKLKTMAKDSL